jgi:hypothetical protein
MKTRTTKTVTKITLFGGLMNQNENSVESLIFIQTAESQSDGRIEIELKGREILGYSELECYMYWLSRRNNWKIGELEMRSYFQSLKDVYHDDADYSESDKFIFFFDDGSREVHIIGHHREGDGLDHETSLQSRHRQFYQSDLNEMEMITEVAV